MTDAEKIYWAHKEKDISFSIIATLMNLDKETVQNLYHQHILELKDTEQLKFDSPITKLNTSTRVINLMRRKGINTIGEFAMIPEGDVPSIKHLGKKSLPEVLKLHHDLQPVLNDCNPGITGGELISKYIEPGVLVRLIPYSLAKTNGERVTPLTCMPDDLQNLDGTEYEGLLRRKKVLRYEVLGTTEHKAYGITGRYKGTYWEKVICVWMNDKED